MIRTLAYVVDGRVGDRLPESSQAMVDAIESGVDVVAGQGNGMDTGPYFLGSDAMISLRRNDVEPLLLAAKRTNTPFVFSLGAGGGTDFHLNNHLDVVDEIARDNGIKLRVAKISGEVSHGYLREKLRRGVQMRRSIDNPRLSEYLTEQDIDDCVRVQAQMGPEPIVEALEAGDIDGVVTGRAVDLAIHMAYPLTRGIPHAVGAHLGKVVECATHCTVQANSYGGILCELDEQSFTVSPLEDIYQCTPASVASHSLYERESPFEERNPGGSLNIVNAKYEALDERTVRVSGMEWNTEPYTVKLEGAKMIGYQAAALALIRDPAMIAALDDIEVYIKEHLLAVSPSPDIQVNLHMIGRDAVLGTSEPLRKTATPHEVGILLLVTAPTQEMATQLATTGRIRLFLVDFPGRQSTAGNTATPLQQASFPLGPAYVFNVWHLLPLDDPCEPFKQEIIELG
jgi:hypothetical protein